MTENLSWLCGVKKKTKKLLLTQLYQYHLKVRLGEVTDTTPPFFTLKIANNYLENFESLPVQKKVLAYKSYILISFNSLKNSVNNLVKY